MRKYAEVTVTMRRNQRTRQTAATECGAVLDSDLFKALCEPVRLDLVRLLIARGRSDLSELAGELPQDPSVISRHLAVLHRAGLVRREKTGRHVYFELDGPSLLGRIDAIRAQLQRVVPFCCPGSSRTTVLERKEAQHDRRSA
jgi:DNA-binding transcriptional ArsR family regulator